MNTRCPPKRVPSAARFFTLCRLTVQLPQSYSVGGQRSSGQLTGKPAGTRPDYRGRWCAELFGAVQITPLSSGYSLGSSNWIIQSHYEKVSYVSGSSLLTTHPQPMDQSSLKNSDVLILTGLTQIPTANPDGMLGEFCSNLAMTVHTGGNVLVPCYSSGVIYDLLECLYQFIDSASLTTIPFYFISPVANSSLEFSQIFAEWLCHNKQSKVYLPEPPFPHAELIQTNKLKHYPSVHGDFSNDFKQPCVVFTGHPSLRFGDVVHFMELWGKSSLNTIIFTEPDFSYLEALAPYQPLAMKCVYCPIDTRLNFIQVSKLLKEVQPLHVVCPEQYVRPPPAQSHRSDLMLDCQPPTMPYRRCSVLSLPFRRRYERIELLPELADSLVPSEIKPGISVATVTAVLHSKDNKHVLRPTLKLALAPPPSKKRKRVLEEPPEHRAPKPLLSGAVPIEQFLATLQKHRLLRGFLTEVNASYDDLLLHNNVRWLSKDRGLECFWAIREEIRSFLSEQKSEKAAQFTEFLEDVEKMQTAAFLADITSHLNELNVKLQGQNNTVCDLITAVWAFQRKLEIYKTDLQGELVHFPKCLEQTQGEKDVPHHADFIQKLMDNFKAHFDDFTLRRQLLLFIQNPFLVTNQGITEVKVEDTPDGHILHLQDEDTLIQLEEDSTHIICDNNEMLRATLRDLVLRFLQKF
ncbi:UNVERIFIED_CONTAM: hypothetical protein FKN15_008789 [Acipenser sinensis]